MPVPEKGVLSPLATTSVKPPMDFFFKPITNIPEDSFMPPLQPDLNQFFSGGIEEITKTTTTTAPAYTSKAWLPGLFISNDSIVDSFHDNSLYTKGSDPGYHANTVVSPVSYNTTNGTAVGEPDGTTNRWGRLLSHGSVLV